VVLTVTPKPTKVSTPVTICSGETYWAANATAYTVGGTYTKLNDGCTANQELNDRLLRSQPDAPVSSGSKRLFGRNNYNTYGKITGGTITWYDMQLQEYCNFRWN
jgi:hypothetical protein